MILVTSYINPDLDGVACAIAYSTYLSDGEAIPRFAGKLNAETVGVLSRLRVDDAILISEEPPTVDEVVLVDCHHPAQLPHIGDMSRVTLVIDHHPDGDPAAFPSAVLQNEVVGAAATLVAERIEARDDAGLAGLRAEHAALLACAIASNTLDFVAPSTTDRDRITFDSLAVVASSYIAFAALLEDMRGWRHSFLSRSTDEAVGQDVKIIEGTIGAIAVSQLEGDGASALLDRADLRDAVQRLGERAGVVGSLLSLVDTAAGTTTLLTADKRIREALMTLAPTVIDEFTLRLPVVALRKTHIIPTLAPS
ncbi:DHH family phosphoesterase [Nocardia elegans]|uniref:DHH family phosphoesterase n=1 Tax=Nocardia elegans TaxID=300029 RepID=A0ABW6TJI4_9NOCA